jgi:hypothetical protein
MAYRRNVLEFLCGPHSYTSRGIADALRTSQDAVDAVGEALLGAGLARKIETEGGVAWTPVRMTSSEELVVLARERGIDVDRLL